MLQTGSLIFILLAAMGIGPVLGFIYLGLALVYVKIKKLLTG